MNRGILVTPANMPTLVDRIRKRLRSKGTRIRSRTFYTGSFRKAISLATAYGQEEAMIGDDGKWIMSYMAPLRPRSLTVEDPNHGAHLVGISDELLTKKKVILIGTDDQVCGGHVLIFAGARVIINEQGVFVRRRFYDGPTLSNQVEHIWAH